MPIKEGCFYSHELYTISLYSKAIDLLSANVYITIDLDVFDPSIMPSTGTLKPGGPDYFGIDAFSEAGDCQEECSRPLM